MAEAEVHSGSWSVKVPTKETLEGAFYGAEQGVVPIAVDIVEDRVSYICE